MHCWKIINIERDFGITRLVIMSCLMFVLAFSFSYVFLSYERLQPYTDNGIFIFILIALFIYPIHKFFHYLFLIDYRKVMRVKIKFRYHLFLIIHLKVKKIVPRYRYIISLMAPFILLNGLILYFGIAYPTYGHYASLLFGIHNLICVIDLLNIKSMIRAPYPAYIEETPKGYEVLIPIYAVGNGKN